MPDFQEISDEYGRLLHIEPHILGAHLLACSALNKGSAFTLDERILFNLIGKLPTHIESLESQISRLYRQYQLIQAPIEKNLFLYRLKQYNETAFYKIISENLEEMLPIIYTPTIGEAVKQHSFQFSLPQGIHLAYPQRNQLEQTLAQLDHQNIELIIITDGEAVLGIGDWGIGGIDICVGKLAVYTCCGGINPRHMLPIQLDVGTNNTALLDDPMYLGWRHERITGQAYHDFVDQVVTALTQQFPNTFIHWEDFGRDNARAILERHRDKLCTFNDDMQGTGATATACILSALKSINQPLKDQRILFMGAGTAGTGIADQLTNAMVQAGLSLAAAQERIWLIDQAGLLCDDTENLTTFQKPYAKNRAELPWQHHTISLAETVEHLKPSILIGCSAQPGAFNESIVSTMAAHTHHPIIFPLSNPTHLAEAIPQDLINWTQGRALIATGSPFQPVQYQDQTIPISQCNNAFVFPGIGLGILAAKATRVTDAMIAAACHALAECSPRIQDKTGPILPGINQIHTVSRHIALAVAHKAREEKITHISDNIDLKKRIDGLFWTPQYLPYQKPKEDKT